MNRVQVYFEEQVETDSPLDLAIECVLGATIVFGVLAFGSIEPWAEFIVQCGVALAAVLMGVRLAADPSQRIVWSLAYLPIFVFLALVVAQLLTLPAHLIESLSPNTVKLKRDLLSDLPDVASLTETMKLSFYAEPTLRQLRQTLMAATVFIIVVNHFRSIASIRRMLGIIASLGAGVAVLAIAQTLSGTDKIYWTVPVNAPIAEGGPFANHSHFGQFMNLAMGGMLALLLLTIHDQLGSRFSLSDLLDRIRVPEGRLIWLLGIGLLLGAVAIVLSLSRAAVLAMLISFVLASCVYSVQHRRGGAGWIAVIFAVILFAIVLYLGFDRISTRFADLHDAQPISVRVSLVQSCISAWGDFPLTGIGLGAFRFVFPKYDTLSDFSVATHAENEYAQLLMETGLIGVGAIGVFILCVFAGCLRALRAKGSAYAPIAVGLGYGWIAILLQSASDFGQHMPGIANLTAVTCGLLVGVGRLAGVRRLSVAPVEFRGSQLARGLAVLAITGIAGVSLLSAHSVWQAERRWVKVLEQEDAMWAANWLGSDEQFSRLLTDAEQVVQMRPGNVIYRGLLNEYRTRAIMTSRDPDTGEALFDDVRIEIARQIVERINQTRVLCPTHGPLLAGAGSLMHYVLKDPRGEALIDRAIALAPNDANTLFLAGRIAADRGDFAVAAARFARYGQVFPSGMPQAIDLLVRKYNKPAVALESARGMSAATSLPGLFETFGVDESLLREARLEAMTQYQRQLETAGASAELLASIARLHVRMSQQHQAAENFARAVALNPFDTRLRLDYANVLIQLDRRDAALEQLDILLSQEPNHPQAKQLRLSLIAPATQPI